MVCSLLVKAGNTPYPHKYGKNSNTPTDTEVLNALNAIPECKTGQTNMKYFEFPLTDPVFAGGAAGSQGPDRVVGISQTPPQGVPRTYIYCLSMTHRGASNSGAFVPCDNAP